MSRSWQPDSKTRTRTSLREMVAAGFWQRWRGRTERRCGSLWNDTSSPLFFRTDRVLLELNVCGLDRSSVVQSQLNREVAGDGADRGGCIPVEDELGRAEPESAVSFGAGCRRIQQHAGRNGR